MNTKSLWTASMAVALVAGAAWAGDCDADFNGDGAVDGADLGQLLGAWGDCAGCPQDLTGDDVVDGADLGILLGAWGDCPLPSCGACLGTVCDSQVGVTGTFVQECQDGQWVSLAYPILTGGDTVDTVSSVHNSNTGLGDIYLCAGTCDGPDVANGILATLCCAIEGEPAGEKVEHCFPAVATSATEPTWVIFVFRSSFSFDVAFDSATEGTTGAAYGNLDGGSDPALWEDLDAFDFGGCYCVDLFATGCEAPTYECVTCPTGAEGDCCEANGTPGCDDTDCCETVCTTDPVCCTDVWDQACADIAADIDACNCGGGLCPPNPACPGDGACDEGNGSPGCDDVECCNCVCAFDPFCCDVEWDQNCADEAELEEGCIPILFADDCEDAIAITDGTYSFTTIDATTDGPDLPETCEEGFGLALVNDIWFLYTATCSGTATVTTCDSADYDTRLAAYNAPCIGDLVGCNDDGDGCTGFTSILEFPVTEGETYLIRVGGFGGSGSGEFTVSCSP